MKNNDPDGGYTPQRGQVREVLVSWRHLKKSLINFRQSYDTIKIRIKIQIKSKRVLFFSFCANKFSDRHHFFIYRQTRIFLHYKNRFRTCDNYHTKGIGIIVREKNHLVTCDNISHFNNCKSLPRIVSLSTVLKYSSADIGTSSGKINLNSPKSCILNIKSIGWLIYRVNP